MKRFPIMKGPSVPWELVAPYEAQAKRNHDQSLEELAARGGLDPGELWAVVHGKHWVDAPDKGNARAWLDTWLTEQRKILVEAAQESARKAGEMLVRYKEAAADQLQFDMKAILSDTPERRLLLRAQAAEAELERWRHGATIEGDFVCPNELLAVNAKQDAVREVIRSVAGMSPDERMSLFMQIFGTFCRECFCPEPCYCSRDE